MTTTTTTSGVLEQVVAQRERLAHRLASVTRVIAVGSGKGGVGKSALTANLATLFAGFGLQVGAVDADLNGPTLAQMLGARGQTLTLTDDGVEPAVGSAGVRLMSVDLFLAKDETPVDWQRPNGLAEDSYVWRGAMEATAVREFLADTLWGELDVLFIDLPPGFERFSTLARLIPGLEGVTVTIPSAASHLVLRKAVAAARAHGTLLVGLIENMSGYACESCGRVGPLFTQEPGGEQLAADLELPFLGSVPFDPHLASACNEGRPPLRGSPACDALEAVAGRIFHAPEDPTAGPPTDVTEAP